MKCKNCGKKVAKYGRRWYHRYSLEWYCHEKHAEPEKEGKT
jgi:hypothetical protein